MTSAERLCMVAARSEALLADFVVLFLVRWGLKYIGVEYFYFQPVLDQTSPPLSLSDFQYPASAIFYGTMYFVSGLPELILAGMWGLYALVMLPLFGQTLGMRQVGIALAKKDGGRPGILRVLIRQLVAPLSSIALLGYWTAIFARDASALHDLASGTKIVYIVKKPAAEIPESPGG